MARAGESEGRSLRALRRFLYVLAVVPVIAGGATVVLGSGSVPSPGDVSPNLESELRFYAVWWVGAGVFLAWLAGRVATATRELRVFCALLFAAGCARIVGIVADGVPSGGQVALMAIELTLPALLVAWQAGATSGRTGAQRGYSR